MLSKITVRELKTKYKVIFNHFDKGAVLMLKEIIAPSEWDYDDEAEVWYIKRVPRNLEVLRKIAREYFELSELIRQDGNEFKYFNLKTMSKVAEQPSFL